MISQSRHSLPLMPSSASLLCVHAFAGLMEEEMSEEDAWEMVKDFIQEGHVPLAVARAADVAGDRK